MVHPSADEIRRLEVVAREVFESGDESGYLVGVATSQHSSFSRSRRPASALERELFLEAVKRAGSHQGFYVEDVNGGVDLISDAGGGRLRKYRFKRGTLTAAGEYVFLCGIGSSLLTAEPETLWGIEERWILGYFSAEDHTVAQMIAAEVIGSEGAGPVKLRLGTIIQLSVTPPPRGFTSTDEGLDGFDDIDGDDELGDSDVA